MRRFLSLVVTVAVSGDLGLAGAHSALAAESAPGAAVPDDARPVLSNASPWRWHVAWRRPQIVAALRAADKPDVLKPGIGFDELADTERIVTPPPAAGWTQPGFDDFDWSRGPVPIVMTRGHMGNPHVSVGLLSVRGRFLVDDPQAVTGLYLALGYRGGAVVYLNGKEVARGHLPDGPLSPATPGQPYPDEAWVGADGKPLPRPQDMKPEHKTRAAKRERQLGPVPLPVAQLRRGLNILAIEVHRSDFPPIAQTWWSNNRFMYGYYNGWTPLAVNDVQLSATGSGFTANVARPPGVHIGAVDVVDRLDEFDFPDPNALLGAGLPTSPIVIPAARNGPCSGALVISGTEAIRGVQVTVGDLTRKSGGGRIPATAVRVRYVSRGKLPADDPRAREGFDVFADEPPTEVLVQKRGSAALPVWLTVQVPRDAPAGDYEGQVTVVVADAEPVKLPLRVTVAGWTVPDPQAFRTVVNIYQSPTTLALYYKVPEWSEAHWRLMDKSFALLAPFGMDLVNVPISDQTQFGNDEGLVVWIKKPDGTYDYDFTVFDRYIRLVKKHLGTPRFVSLQVWHGCMYEQKNEQKNTVTVLDPATGRREHMQVPVFGTPESKPFWTPVLRAIKERLAKAGLDRSLCLGILSDGTGTSAMLKMFAEILPGVGWTRGCHFQTFDTKPTPLPGGSAIVCHEFCYATGVQDPSRMVPRFSDFPDRPGVSYFRGERDYTPLPYMRLTAQRALCGSTRGFGRVGLDFWNLRQEAGGKTVYANVYNRWPHSTCNQREPTTWGLAQPGPDGALWTVRLQLLLEGVQEAEALVFVIEALERNAPELGPELAERCRALFVEILQNCRQSQYAPLNCGGWRNRTARLYALAAEVAEKLGEKRR